MVTGSPAIIMLSDGASFLVLALGLGLALSNLSFLGFLGSWRDSTLFSALFFIMVSINSSCSMALSFSLLTS